MLDDFVTRLFWAESAASSFPWRHGWKTKSSCPAAKRDVVLHHGMRNMRTSDGLVPDNTVDVSALHSSSAVCTSKYGDGKPTSMSGDSSLALGAL